MKRANSRSRFRFTGPKWQNCHNVCVMMWCLQDVPRSVLLARFVPCVVMNSKPKRRKCRHCGKLFTPDYRNYCRQRYCSNSECQRASKAASRRRWLRKLENLTYFRGELAKENTRKWRKEHPGYWRKKPPSQAGDQTPEPQTVKPEQESHNVLAERLGTIQELCPLKSPLFIGLLSVITGSTLQEDIVATIDDLIIRGSKILGLGLPGNGALQVAPNHDERIINDAQSAMGNPGQP